MKKKLLSKKLFIYFVAAFFVTIFSFAIYSLVTGIMSLGQLDGWDGVSVATSFSHGNGTEENPYMIHDPSEFIYFKKLIEGEDSSIYRDKYYALADDINFNGNIIDPIGIVEKEEERYFSGHFNGNGYVLENFKITNAVVIDEIEYYSLFTKTNQAFISSLGVKNYRIEVQDNDSFKVVSPFVGELIGLEISDDSIEKENTVQENIAQENVDGESLAVENSIEENTTEIKNVPFCKNIYLVDFYMDTSKVSDNSIVSVFTGNVVGEASIQNVFLRGEVNANSDISSIYYAYVDEKNISDISMIISSIKVLNQDSNVFILDGIEDIYFYQDEVFTRDNETVATQTVLSLLNDGMDNDHYWTLEEGSLLIREYEKVTQSVPITSRSFAFSLRSSPAVGLHDSGLDSTNGVVYINDLDSDLNYYKGLNYTGGGTVNTIPSGDSYSLYDTNSNLAKVYIAYKGSDINETNNLVGYVSLDEQISDFIYYKYYPVESGYITISLIDNPYADRPNDKAFNGWVTDYDGAVVSLDTDTYTRYVKIPAPSDLSSPISITMYASWTEATAVVASVSRGTLTTTNLKSIGMNQIATRAPYYNPHPTLYNYSSIRSGTGNNGTAYPTGAVDGNGNSLNGQRCRKNGNQQRTCYYYIAVAESDVVEGSTSYYYLNNGSMQSYTFTIGGYRVSSSILNEGDNVVGFFKKGVPTGSLVGYYSSTGVIQTSGSCSGNTCNNYYELVQYDSNNVLSDSNYEYYYLVTRDTNIAYLTGNITGFSNSKPVTVTGLNNGSNRSNYQVNLTSYSIDAGADLRVEYCSLYTGEIQPSTSGQYYDSSNNIYGNYYNLKIGRGIPISTGTYTTGSWYNQETHEGTYNNARGITGGDDSGTGSNGSPTKYTLIVESGYYNSISSVSPRGATTRYSYYVDATSIYGCDFDRVSNVNSKLGVNYNATTSYGGYIRGGSSLQKYMTTFVKSGTFGENLDEAASGIYVGGLTGGTIYSPVELIVEGGDIYNINGGPLISDTVKSNNIIYIYMKGGRADFIFGGAAVSTTYGNRIISVTGGQIDYAVFGGSNGTEGTDGDGKIDGDSFVYIGGSAVIGDDLDAATIWGVSPGSVFGVGNGNASYSTIGSCNNSNIIIDNSATIKRNVYGGGNYGSVGSSSSTSADVNIKINGGNVQGSVFGGSNTRGVVYGDTNVTINGGVISNDVYGGGEGGYTSSTVPGTYVRDNVNVVINNGTITGNVYGGSAYGSVNTANETTTTSVATTTVAVNNGTVAGSVYGGGKGGDKSPKVIGDITVNINGGSIGKVFGGFDASGSPNAGDVVYLNGGTIGSAFGGGNNVGQTNTDIRLQGSTITGNLYGGSNLLGDVTTSHVTVTSGRVGDIYGGNNLGGSTATTNVNITGGSIGGDIYGGGNEAPSTTSNVTINGASANDVYGGGKRAGLTTSNVTILNGSFDSVFGGSNISGVVGTSNVGITSSSGNNVYGGNNQGGQTNDTNVNVSYSSVDNVFGGGDNAASGVSHVTINGGFVDSVYGGGNEAGLTTSNVTILRGSVANVYGGSNQLGNITTSNVTIGDTTVAPNATITITNLYGGNNLGGVTTTANIVGNIGTVDTIYGGGNEASVGSTNVTLSDITATDVYGGGNAAAVTGNAYLDLDDCIVSNNIYGGGNEGVVEGNTEVFVTDSHIEGNAFAGGNGSTAVVYGNSTITIDGSTEIGTSTSVAPNEGCVFGSGNAASTGRSTTNNSVAMVNIVGGTIHGNVYGGPKMAVVYGVTETNIGTAAVNNNSLTEDNIIISGTVFGGGESNASGSTTYDWTFISVTQGITVNIDGTNYENHGHDFIINGSIFGSGNASSSSGDSEIYIKHLGSLLTPNKSVSIQRANYLEIESSVIELEGATDRTNEYSDIVYSFNIIDKLVIKNGTTLLLQHNANLLKELYSGADVGGVLVPATVDIYDDTKEVILNADNRIYMVPGQNLNVTINQNATAYGRITGMTFFGMYLPNDGNYRFGLYDSGMTYGDSANASLEIVGGSYVVGMQKTNHDITKDGFYSNYLDEDTYTEIVTAYINPSAIGTIGYRWTIGFEAINYEFTLLASKYASLGTTELQLVDFASGDTIFTILGVDTSGLDTNITLVDSADVPRIGRTMQQANQIFGLSMRAETQEWTGYGLTKFYSQDGGYVSGTREYRTDSRQLAPSLMFYLYHAKNIAAEGDLGNVVITVQAAIPRNAIEYDIEFITITANIVARQWDDADSYDASITYDKRYEMPSSTSVNITNTSQFTAYYSLIAWSNQFSGIYGLNNDYFHTLVTNNPLPVGTMITMLDYGVNYDRPEYYYFRVTQSVYDDSLLQLQNYYEVTYPLSSFIKMDSTSSGNTYSDSDSNLIYYDSEIGLVDEEFIFIFDFKECTQVTGDHLDNTMLFELRTTENRTIYNVLGIREPVMVYNTYESSNVVLEQTITDPDSYLYYDIPDEITYSTDIQYDETENRQSVIDTNYESSSMGLNITFLDRNRDPVSSSLLVGTSFFIDNRQYFADGDGVFRIKLANKVSNLIREASLTVYKNLPPGEYTLRYTLFASDDGLHNSNTANSVSREYTVTVVSSDNSLIVNTADFTKLVDGETALNMNDTNTNTYTVKYQSVLTNPNFRVEVYKRSIASQDSLDYVSVPFSQLFQTVLSSAGGNEVYISMDGLSQKNFNFQLQDTLTSGTYRVVFKLYDNNQLIDSDEKYVIVHKKLQ